MTTERTRLERSFDRDSVRELVAAAEREVAISGPTLTSAAFAAGLVDEVQLLVVPAIVGGGLRALPDDVRLDLQLRETRTFDASGTVFLRYDVRRSRRRRRGSPARRPRRHASGTRPAFPTERHRAPASRRAGSSDPRR